MTLICYQEKRFSASSTDVIDQANDIIAAYRADGYTLTLRQLFYQFVARDLIPNNVRSYKRIGSIVSDARLAGLISWSVIEDQERTCKTPFIQPSEVEALSDIEYGYAPDLWADQENYVEIWIEKAALVNVISRPAERYDVPYLACKGYLSQSEAWRAAQRFQEEEQRGKHCVLIHLGDHDPSGIDMTRDNQDRLDLFGVDVRVRRIALNRDQIDHYDPPPNPAKVTDSRAAGYIERHGDTSWELDALEPRVIARLVEDEIKSLIDLPLFEASAHEAEEKRARLRWISQNAEATLTFAGDMIGGGDDE